MHMPMPGVSNFEEIYTRPLSTWGAHTVSVSIVKVCASWTRRAATTIPASCHGGGSTADGEQLSVLAGVRCESFRTKFSAGGFMPTPVRCPIAGFRRTGGITISSRLDTVGALADKIQSSPRRLPGQSPRSTNSPGRVLDPNSGRGGNAYDRFFGDPTVKPNPSLAPIETAPFMLSRSTWVIWAPKGG